MNDFSYFYCVLKFKWQGTHLAITATSLVQDFHRNGKDGENVSSLCNDESFYNFHLNTLGSKKSLDCFVSQKRF